MTIFPSFLPPMSRQNKLLRRQKHSGRKKQASNKNLNAYLGGTSIFGVDRILGRSISEHLMKEGLEIDLATAEFDRRYGQINIICTPVHDAMKVDEDLGESVSDELERAAQSMGYSRVDASYSLRDFQFGSGGGKSIRFVLKQRLDV